MPALVNISVGSLRGTSGDDGTISWPLSAKNLRNVDLISLTPLMLVQSQYRPGSARNCRSFLQSSGAAGRQTGFHFAGRAPSFSAAGRKTGFHFCWPRLAAPLLDKGTSAVQKLCKPIRGLPQQRKTFDRCCSCVDSLVVAVFSSYVFKTITSGEIGLDAGAEGATAPETLRQTDPRDLTASGKRHRRVLARMCPPTG